jgi:uncharacterized NAD(P)/FAD-binding protein YdhS
MVSTGGLLPRVHKPGIAAVPPALPAGPLGLRDLVNALRTIIRKAEAEGVDWRAVIDGLRSRTNEIWQGLSICDQKRFLRHLIRYWNVHRHRMAPQIGARVDEALRSGELVVHRGRVVNVAISEEAAEARARLGSGTTVFRVSKVINCTGLDYGYQRGTNPLLQSLFQQGLIDASAHGAGVRTDRDGAVVSRQGVVSTWLYAIGPMRFGELLETTAVPEIREQAQALARLLQRDPRGDDSAGHPAIRAVGSSTGSF